MRSFAVLLSLVATVASAQQPRAPATPPPSAEAAPAEPTPPPLSPAQADPSAPPLPPAATPPPAIGPAESTGERAVRYSRFSAGPGGPLLAFTQVISGIVSGAMIGSTYNDENSDEGRNHGYTGAMLGGLTLGTIGTLYQYAVPVERNESFLVAGAATTGFIAGIGLANSDDASDRARGWMGLAATQVGIVSVLAITQGGGDVSNGDAALVGMTSLYAFTLTLLTQSIMEESGSGDTDFTPTLLAPAIGMALGGLLALPLELEASRVVKLTLLPLGVGLGMLWLGSALADGTTVPLTAIAGIATTFALTVLLTSDPGVPTEKDSPRRVSSVQAMPVPVVMAAGRDNSSLAAGPGLFMRF
ncbi:hypothetical protein [Hyalangium rubrum]|uniref:Uncharacterized protein n=1 Tax=Hyalangium rubrum TaxID=3103134 RepID=A0ABU5H281_9BACT|nr:hypothetical protein [Hyalangium sp. s54d21]MDY7226210.1 hypothetical protein [Hyalangium sp. s54d21]